MPQRPQINYINFIGTSSRILCSDLLCGFERLTHLCAAVSGVGPAHVAGDGGAGEAPRVGRVGGGRVARRRHLRVLQVEWGDRFISVLSRIHELNWKNPRQTTDIIWLNRTLIKGFRPGHFICYSVPDKTFFSDLIKFLQITICCHAILLNFYFLRKYPLSVSFVISNRN